MLDDYNIKMESTLHLVRVRGGGGIQFNSLTQEMTGTICKNEKTEENKHTFFVHGVNFVGKCDNHKCRIQNETQYFQKGLGSFLVNKEGCFFKQTCIVC